MKKEQNDYLYTNILDIKEVSVIYNNVGCFLRIDYKSIRTWGATTTMSKEECEKDKDLLNNLLDG